MPKDKSATSARILTSMREEFLSYGYEKASLNRIAKKVGITTAGLYKHYHGKEDMFAALVRETLDGLNTLNVDGMEQLGKDPAEFDPFHEEWSRTLVDFIFDHYDGAKLLICCAHGSRFESFEEDLIQREAESNRQYAELLARRGKRVKPLTEMQWHLLSTEYIHLVFEIVRHDLTREEAYRHMAFVRALLYPGWKEILGL